MRFLSWVLHRSFLLPLSTGKTPLTFTLGLMTTPRELAEELNAALEAASARCNESLSIVKQHESLGELNVYARLVGMFLGHSYTNILAPLWEQYPELEPVQMKGEYVERQPMLSPESREAISAFLVAAKPALHPVCWVFVGWW